MSNAAFGFRNSTSFLRRSTQNSSRQGVNCLNKGSLISNVPAVRFSINGPTFTVINATISQNVANPASSSWSSQSPLVLRNTGAGYMSTPMSNVFVFGSNYLFQQGSFRFYMNTVSTTRSQTMWFYGNANAGIAFFILNSNRRLYFQFNGVASYQISATAIAAGQWYHVDFRISGSSYVVYLNGTLSLTTPAGAGPNIPLSTDPFVLCGNPLNTGLWSDIFMTDVVSCYSDTIPSFTPSVYVNASWR